MIPPHAHPQPPRLVTAEDPDLPVHEISRVEDRARVLAEALAHAEALEEQYKVLPADPPRTGLWKVPLASGILVASLLLALAPPGWLAGSPEPRPTPEDTDRGLRAAMVLQAHQVEAFRLQEGRLPASLSELSVVLPGLTLVRSNNRVYQIRGRRADGAVEVYDSSRPSPEFDAAAPWVQREAP